jgi:hypothetical protein
MGFRNPTTQDQYIGFNVGSAILLGSAPDNLTRFVETLPINGTVGQGFAGGNTVTIDGTNMVTLLSFFSYCFCSSWKPFVKKNKC